LRPDVEELNITSWDDDSIQPVTGLLEGAMASGRWLGGFADREFTFHIDEAGFRRDILDDPAFSPEGALVAKTDEAIVGFALAVIEEGKETGFISLLAVDPKHQRKGIGSDLLNRSEEFLASRGARQVRISHEDNPLYVCAGLDLASPAYPFLANRGYRTGQISFVMQMDCDEFELGAEIPGFVEGLAREGVKVGFCGSEHMESLREVFHAPALDSVLAGDPPYPVLVATEGPRVVGVSGPIWVRKRGGPANFLGVFTDEGYRRRKIGTVLFNLMCDEFKKLGAAYSDLYTGLDNPGREIYLQSGYKVKYLMDEVLEKQLA
jgi:GNAT superfamily N-acetyltransferase